MLLIAVGCTRDNAPEVPDPDAGRQRSVVDIALTLGEAWDIDDDASRAAPPGVEVDNTDSHKDIADIDKVRVVTFRRKEGDANGEFYYDAVNDKTLEVTLKEQGEHKHSIATGTITKTYGYEYRVIAIAYSSAKKSTFASSFSSAPDGEDNWMTLSGDTYSTFCAKLNTVDCSGWNDYLWGQKDKPLSDVTNHYNTNSINPQILQTPQLFFGTLHSSLSESEIIPFAEEDATGELNAKVALTGLLKRGVAKVELHITPVNEPASTYLNNTDGDVQWITVLAQTPNTKVGLTSYDDFLRPSEPIIHQEHLYNTITLKYEDYTQYTAVAHLPVTSGMVNQSQSIPIWFLPCKTKLAIRVKTDKSGSGGFTHLRNGEFTLTNIENHGDNGTGIVSPDVIDNVFHLRRNHKYIINVLSSETVLTKHSID